MPTREYLLPGSMQIWLCALGFVAAFPAQAQSDDAHLFLPFPEQTIEGYRKLGSIDPALWQMLTTAEGDIAQRQAKLPKRVQIVLKVTQPFLMSTPKLSILEEDLIPLGGGFIASRLTNAGDTGEASTAGLTWMGFVPVHRHAHVRETHGPLSLDGTRAVAVRDLKVFEMRPAEARPGYRFRYDWLTQTDMFLLRRTRAFKREPEPQKVSGGSKGECVAEKHVPSDSLVSGLQGNALMFACTGEVDLGMAGRTLVETTYAYFEDYAWFVQVYSKNKDGFIAETKITVLKPN
jgi:hypothetical protein